MSWAAGLKLLIEKCLIGSIDLEFPGRTANPLGVASHNHKIEVFLSNVHFPKSLPKFLSAKQVADVIYSCVVFSRRLFP